MTALRKRIDSSERSLDGDLSARRVTILKSPVISEQCAGMTSSTSSIKEAWLSFGAYTPHTVTGGAWLVLTVAMMKRPFGSVVTSDMETPFFKGTMAHPLCLAEKEEKWA